MQSEQKEKGVIMYDVNKTVIMNGLDIEYLMRGLEISDNIGTITQKKLEDLQKSIKRMKQPVPKINECKTLQDFLEASYHDENYDYDTRYSEGRVGRYYISWENMLEIDNRLIQLHNGTEKMLFKINGIEKFIQSKI